MHPTWSPDGTKIAFIRSTPGSGRSDIYMMDADGSNLTRLTATLGGQQRSFSGLSWSPDGTKIVFSTRDDPAHGNNDIYVINSDGTEPRALLGESTNDAEPAWSPDGSQIAFVRVEEGLAAVYMMNADGTGITRLTEPSSGVGGMDWSPDGSRIAFSNSVDGRVDIYVMNSDGSGIRNLTQSPQAREDYDPDWSPDGTKILFTRGPLASDVFVMNADGSGQTNLTNDLTAVNGGADWRPVPGLLPGGLPETGTSLNFDGSARSSGGAVAIGALVTLVGAIVILQAVRRRKV